MDVIDHALYILWQENRIGKIGPIIESSCACTSRTLHDYAILIYSHQRGVIPWRSSEDATVMPITMPCMRERVQIIWHNVRLMGQ